MTPRSPTTGLLNINDQVRFMSCHEPIICQRCGSAFLVVLIREGPDFNNFGLRHCPFCGRLTDTRSGHFFTE